LKNIFLVTVIYAAFLIGCVSKIGRGDDYTFYVQFRDNDSVFRIGDSLNSNSAIMVLETVSCWLWEMLWCTNCFNGCYKPL